VSIQHKTASLIEDEGATVVPGKLFSDIIRSLPEAAVTLETNDNNLKVQCFDSEFIVHCLNPADFPLFPQFDSRIAANIPAGIFSSMVKKVVKAVSKDESRAVLTGVLIKINGADIQMVATDSYRMAITKGQLEEPVEDPASLIVPGDILDEIRRLITNQKEVMISDSENQVIFSFEETTFITRKIEGSYPNFEAIVPSEKNISATVDAGQLTEAVRRIAITAQAHTPIRFSVNSDIQAIEISSKTQDVASSHEKINAQIEGESIEIGFNPQYIIDGLSVIDTDEVLIEAQSSLKPGIFKSVGGNYFFYLTMPVRIDV
jgi:DNA polymerase-3 subunit beta